MIMFTLQNLLYYSVFLVLLQSLSLCYNALAIAFQIDDCRLHIRSEILNLHSVFKDV